MHIKIEISYRITPLPLLPLPAKCMIKELVVNEFTYLSNASILQYKTAILLFSWVFNFPFQNVAILKCISLYSDYVYSLYLTHIY